MKIAYFIGTLRVQDGVAKVLLRMAEYAHKHGHEAVIITGYAEKEVISPVPVWTVPSVVFPLYKAYRLPKPGMHGFKVRLDEFKPDIIHLHSPDTIAWAALKYARRNNIPIMATHHTAFDRYLPYYHLNWAAGILWFLLRRLYNRLKVITVPSPIMKSDLTKHGVTHVEVFEWGVNLTLFNPKSYSKEWRKKIIGAEDCPILLCVCRLTWEKDLRILAETYTLLKEKLGENSFRMIVSGTGPAEVELKKLMPGAIFKGHLENDELSQTYASSDIFLFPSTTEPLAWLS